MKQKTILCFGDSNTWGFPPDCGARYDRQTRWPGVLQQELGEEYHVIEEGLPGRNTVWDDPVEGGMIAAAIALAEDEPEFAADTITLPTVPGLIWITNNLTTEGTISLLDIPSISTLSPADNATDVFVSANLVATFNRSVQPGTGSIVLKKSSDGSTVQTFDVTTDVVFNGSQITIDPADPLEYTTGYYVMIDPAAIEDLSGAPFAGLSGSAAWNFTTVSASTIVVLNTGSKVVASGLGNSSTTLSFDAGASADMLVVALSSEKGSGDYSVTYDGHSLTQAVLRGSSDIWYLDLGTTPYTGGDADLVVDYSAVSTVNGVGIGAVSISADGEPIRLHTTAGSAVATNTVNLNTTRSNTFVVACFNANGSGAPTVNAPLIPIFESGNTGSAKGAAGYENGVAAGEHTYSWTAGNARTAVAASFYIHNFVNWIADYNVSGETGPADDPDGDRIPNAIEALYGTHPGQQSQGLGNLTVDGTNTTFTHPMNENPPADLSLFYQWSTNLVAWYACDGVDGPPGGETVSVTTQTIDAITTVTATLNEPMDHLFFRAAAAQK